MTEVYAEYLDELLRDLRRVVAELPGERFRAADLLPRLHALEGAPWDSWLPGRPLTAKALSMILLPAGIQTVKVREGGGSFMFYARRDLERIPPTG